MIEWHKPSEIPKDNRLCIVRLAQPTSKKVDYHIGRYTDRWTYAHVRRKMDGPILAWAYINEP